VRNFRDVMANPPEIATRAELLNRLSARDRPAPVRAPAPSLNERLEAVRATANHNEARIAILSRSLEEADGGLNHDFSQSSLKGRSRTDFEICR